jgi:hypothetical protein
MTDLAQIDATTAECDCSDAQLDHVGCDCGRGPRRRPTYAEQVADQDRVCDELIDKAMEREHLAEMAYWDAFMAEEEKRGYAWDPKMGEQPADEHVRAFRTTEEQAEKVLLAA